MAIYHPMAMAECSLNKETELFTYNGCMRKEDALKQFEIWEDLGFKIKKAWIDEMEDGKIVCKYEVEKKYAIKMKMSGDSHEQFTI